MVQSGALTLSHAYRQMRDEEEVAKKVAASRRRDDWPPAMTPEPVEPEPLKTLAALPRDGFVRLARPVLLGEHNRVKVIGYDAAIGAPDWLARHLAGNAAA
jgi:hypothetical protein